MRTLLQALLDIILPPTCLACYQPRLPQEKYLCLPCLATLPPADLETPLKKENLLHKFHSLAPFQATHALYHFSKKSRVQHLLHSLKYRYQPHALCYLGTLLAAQWQQQKTNNPIDLIIPVPLHHKRYQVRGYNQSALLAQGISQTLNIPLADNLLIRTQPTHTQTSKKRNQRFKNVDNAFALAPSHYPSIQGKNILLVDDLVTTGATLSACAQQLLQANPASLHLATLAIALQ